MPRPLVVVALSLLTAACTTALEQARMEVAGDVSATAHMLMSAADTGQIAQYGAQDLARYEGMARQCGATTRRFGGGGKVFLDVNFSAATRDELDVAIQCAKTQYGKFPDLSVETTDGILGQTYVLRLSQLAERQWGYGSGTAKEFMFTMPGEITGFVDRSVAPTVRIQSVMLGGNRIRIQLIDLPDSIRALSDRACPHTPCTNEQAKQLTKDLAVDLRFEVTSKKSKINLESITALAGILFGSGLLVEISRRYFARKQRAPQSPP